VQPQKAQSANDATALFFALLTFAGIIVVDGSCDDFTGGCFLPEDLDFTNDVILFFAAENAFPARSPKALFP